MTSEEFLINSLHLISVIKNNLSINRFNSYLADIKLFHIRSFNVFDLYKWLALCNQYYKIHHFADDTN